MASESKKKVVPLLAWRATREGRDTGTRDVATGAWGMGRNVVEVGQTEREFKDDTPQRERTDMDMLKIAKDMSFALPANWHKDRDDAHLHVGAVHQNCT